MNRIAARTRRLESHTPTQGATGSQRRLLIDINDGLIAASRFLDLVGADHIELVTVTSNRVSLQPADLNEGEQIARALGLNNPMDHRMFVPGNTLWTGERHGLEVQVRSVLRGAVTR
ncbi:hypothetical protein AB1046_08985 [Promicromonospora sp. Populi]|uniref:hypothetical protein n=1 Tax=Promicromonospora sp. Populi TaxID=3239420 RepID=UPI0034E2D310